MADDLARTSTRSIDELLAEHDPHTTDQITFRGAQYDRGLAWVHFPEGFGGLGLPPTRATPRRHAAARRRARRRRTARCSSACPSPGPTMVTHGSDELRKRALRPMFTGEEIWCQLFSEPGAGLRPRRARRPARCATATSGSSTARRCGTRSPTSPTAACSSRAPTPTSRSTRASPTSWSTCTRPASRCGRCARSPARPSSTRCTSPTCAIADADRIGDIGDGWRVSMTTLMNERTTIGGAAAAAAAEARPRLDRKKRSTCGSTARRPRPRRAATGSMQLWIETEVLRLTNIRAARRRPRAGNPGPEGSIAKLALANVNKAIYELCIDLLGADGIVDYDYTFKRPDEAGARRRRSAPRARCSCGPGPTRSRAARRRSCATSSASASSACPASRASTATCRGRRYRAAEQLTSAT